MIRARVLAAPALAATLLLPLAAALSLAACGGSSAPKTTLDVIAGSELKDVEPVLADAERATGVHVAMTYAGTIAGIDRLAGGERHDAAWFAQDKYLALSSAGSHVRTRTRIMLSPVILGVKHSVAERLGWSGKPVTWREVQRAVASGSFRYAMTSPTTSNSGFSAVLSVSTALAGTGDALRPSQVDRAAIAAFYRGQKIVSGSSGWLSDAYLGGQDRADGIITYEASIAALDANPQLREKLDRIYPTDGVVTADYPLDLLNESKKDAYDRLVAYLKSADVQKRIAETTYRRPVDPSAATAQYPAIAQETVFPASAASVQQLLLRFLNQDRVPAHSFYVLDKTGSMENEDGTGKSRIQRVREALGVLAGRDDSLTGQFARFADRERITIVTFSSRVETDRTFQMTRQNDPVVYGAVRELAGSLTPNGNTAIYTALERALEEAVVDAPSDTGRYASIVLMTDGENNRGDDFDAFEQKWRALPEYGRRIHVFPIFIGEANPKELQRIADLTGGRAFDARSLSLAEIFKEIRGYQ